MAYDYVLGLVDTTSVWSIDLFYALQALGIPATYHTSYLGARREHADKVARERLGCTAVALSKNAHGGRTPAVAGVRARRRTTGTCLTRTSCGWSTRSSGRWRSAGTSGSGRSPKAVKAWLARLC